MLAIAGATAFLPATAAALDVWIQHPRGRQFVYGVIDVVASVVSEEQVAVTFFVDEREIGTIVRAPYKIGVDLGDANVEHVFKAVARSASGETAVSTVKTPPLQIDEIIDINLQQLYVTATLDGRRVPDLSRGDFRISEEGQQQSIVTFERGDVPLTAVVLLDCSLSMTGERWEAALRGASHFLSEMKPLDEAMVMLFSDRLLHESQFSSDKEALTQDLQSAEPAGGTALNDHLFLALKRLDQRQGRRAVVLFSDGSDAHSALKMKQVLDKANRSEALIYWIHLRAEGEKPDEVPKYTTAWRDVAANQEEFQDLRTAVRASGGRVEVLTSLDQMSEAFVEILAELREQYVLGYYPSERTSGEWRQVKVRIQRPGVRVRTREGYFSFQ